MRRPHINKGNDGGFLFLNFTSRHDLYGCAAIVRATNSGIAVAIVNLKRYKM